MAKDGTNISLIETFCPGIDNSVLADGLTISMIKDLNSGVGDDGTPLTEEAKRFFLENIEKRSELYKRILRGKND